MQILIGGAPGTGSSVLVQTLNRHTDLVAGPETFAFIHPKLYEDFNTNRKYLLHSAPFGGLKSIGWFRMNGAILLDSWYGWTRDSLQTSIEQSATLPEFANAYFAPVLERNNAKHWVEKSPSNVLTFSNFLETFPDGVVIHTLRNPYDNIASLVARGYSPLYAVGAVLINQAFGEKSALHERYSTIHYQELTTQPEACLKDLFSFLNITFDPSILIAPEDRQSAEMAGWEYSERAPISSGSIGRFERMEPEIQEQILHACTHLRIRDKYAEKNNLQLQTISDICLRWQYPLRKPHQKQGSMALYLNACKDWIQRTVKAYPTGWTNYPLQLHSKS